KLRAAPPTARDHARSVQPSQRSLPKFARRASAVWWPQTCLGSKAMAVRGGERANANLAHTAIGGVSAHPRAAKLRETAIIPPNTWVAVESTQPGKMGTSIAVSAVFTSETPFRPVFTQVLHNYDTTKIGMLTRISTISDVCDICDRPRRSTIQ